MLTIACPECGGKVDPGDHPVKGDIVECLACGTEFEIVSTDPLAIARAPEPQQDRRQ